MKRYLPAFSAAVTLAVLLFPGRANANYISGANASATCSDFSLFVTGWSMISSGTPRADVFVIQSDGSTALAGSMSLPLDLTGGFGSVATFPWPGGTPPIGALSGYVMLSTDSTQTQTPIAWTPTALSCAPICTASIGDLVWNDLNHDGLQQAGEPGINGVKLTLSEFDGSSTDVELFSTTTMNGPTGAAGYYEFVGLCPGTYRVTVDETTLPPGFGPSPSLVGSDRTVDSNGNPAGTTLTSSPDETLDFGYDELPLACPAGGFSFSFNEAGDLVMVFDQFPAPNDNSYGANAVGWPNGHKFGDLVGSDHAGFQLTDPNGVVRLSFNIDYLTASTDAPSGYKSLGPFGGDGKVLIGTLTPADITYTTSLAKNLNGVNIPGLFNSAHVQQFGSVNVLVDSPPTDALRQTYAISDPTLAGWDFHDTYFVTIKASKLAALGFNRSTWKVGPNLDALHNSPAKPCPPGPASLSVTTRTVKDRQVLVTIHNGSTTDDFITGLSLTWPSQNGYLTQVKVGGAIIYDNPDLAPTSATLTLAQLVADQNKRKLPHGANATLTLVFQSTAVTDLSQYSGTVTTTTTSLSILP